MTISTICFDNGMTIAVPKDSALDNAITSQMLTDLDGDEALTKNDIPQELRSTNGWVAARYGSDEDLFLKTVGNVLVAAGEIASWQREGFEKFTRVYGRTKLFQSVAQTMGSQGERGRWLRSCKIDIPFQAWVSSVKQAVEKSHLFEDGELGVYTEPNRGYYQQFIQSLQVLSGATTSSNDLWNSECPVRGFKVALATIPKIIRPAVQETLETYQDAIANLAQNNDCIRTTINYEQGSFLMLTVPLHMAEGSGKAELEYSCSM